MIRPSWDEVWMQVALTVASRSVCSRASVGAVIVTRDNRINSTGHNGPPRGFDHGGVPCSEWCPRAMLGDNTPSYQSCSSIHAETNALVRCDYTQIAGGTLYCSRAICRDCAKMICNSGIARVVQIVTADDAHRAPDEVESYMRSMGLKVERMSGPPIMVKP